MEYTIDQERLLNENEKEDIYLHYSDNSDDLKLAKGILNGFIIELVAAIFIFVVIAAI